MDAPELVKLTTYAIPFAAAAGVLCAAMIAGLAGGMQYLADKRYVTQKEFAEFLTAINARQDDLTRILEAMQQTQESQREMTLELVKRVDTVDRSLQETDDAVQTILTHVQDIARGSLNRVEG